MVKIITVRPYELPLLGASDGNSLSSGSDEVFLHRAIQGLDSAKLAQNHSSAVDTLGGDLICIKLHLEYRGTWTSVGFPQVWNLFERRQTNIFNIMP